MIYRYQWERAVWLIVIVAAIAIAVNFLLGYVGGTALEYDPNLALCMRGVQVYCDKMEIEDLYEQLLNRTKEWNRIHEKN